MREKAGPHKAAAAQPRRPQPSRPGLLRHWRRLPSISRSPDPIGRSTTGGPGTPDGAGPARPSAEAPPGLPPPLPPRRSQRQRCARLRAPLPGSGQAGLGRDGPSVQPGAARLSGAPAAAPRELPPRCCRRPVPGARRGQSRSRPRHPQPPRAGSAPTTPVRGPSPRAPAARSYSRAAPLLPRPGLQMAPARVCPQRSAARATIGSGDSCSRAGDTDPGAFGDCGARGRPSLPFAARLLRGCFRPKSQRPARAEPPLTGWVLRAAAAEPRGAGGGCGIPGPAAGLAVAQGDELLPQPRALEART